MGHNPWPLVPVDVGHNRHEGVPVPSHYLVSVLQLGQSPSCVPEVVGVVYCSASEDTL